MPDPPARAKLIRLYAHEVPLERSTEQDLVERTDGLAGAFIKELMRQAALRAALADRAPTSADAPQPGATPFPAMLHAFSAFEMPTSPQRDP